MLYIFSSKFSVSFLEVLQTGPGRLDLCSDFLLLFTGEQGIAGDLFQVQRKGIVIGGVVLILGLLVANVILFYQIGFVLHR